ncbi:hypothetical protein JHW43_002445 [Diplocarpon mali]|nr:hypothetical protein JHW43_002445 [Diplocarpon mali]
MKRPTPRKPPRRHGRGPDLIAVPRAVRFSSRDRTGSQAVRGQPTKSASVRVNATRFAVNWHVRNYNTSQLFLASILTTHA